MVGTEPCCCLASMLDRLHHYDLGTKRFCPGCDSQTDRSCTKDDKNIRGINVSHPHQCVIRHAEGLHQSAVCEIHFIRQFVQPRFLGLEELSGRATNREAKVIVTDDALADNTVADRQDAQIYGPDDCLTLTFMLMNTLEWMDDRRQRVPQYLAAGDPLTLEGVVKAEVRRDDTSVIPAVIVDDSGTSRWRLEQAGLYFLGGEGLTQTVPVSLALFNAEESSLTRAPITVLPDFSALSRGDGLRRLTRPLITVLLAIAVLEALYLLLLAGRFRRRRGPGSAPAQGASA